MTQNIKAICWLRHDLRLHDHPALTAALKAGPAVAVYILDEATDRPLNRPLGAASRWWLHHSLSSLAKQLAAHHIPLVLRRGNPAQIIPQLMRETGATTLTASACFEPVLMKADKALAEELQSHDISFSLYAGSLLHDPRQLQTKTGGFYKVYSPFSRQMMEQQIPQPLPAPTQEQAPATPSSDTLESWKLLPTKPDWSGGMQAFWQPGEAAALELLHNFNDGAIQHYSGGRDQPGRDYTSKLSPYLAFGEISPRQIWHAVRHAADRAGTGMDRNRETYIKELIWRDFAAHTLYHQPHLPQAPLDQRFEKFTWLDSDVNLRAWQRGKTGYPIVDAGMRQLWQTGWMHNRVRMIVASFLTKHLLIKWQEGETWFWDTLVDADLASNTFNWQWVAGSGADAAPYFRIFNPMLQGIKFDPEGDYVRQYVPELAKMPAKYIHEPWNAPADILAKAGVKLGGNYPAPIVDHSTARNRALAAFEELKS